MISVKFLLLEETGHNVFGHTPSLVYAAAGYCRGCATILSLPGFKMAAPRSMSKHDLKQQQTFNVELGSCGVLDMSRVYHKTLFGPMFYSWWNCPLSNLGGMTNS